MPVPSPRPIRVLAPLIVLALAAGFRGSSGASPDAPGAATDTETVDRALDLVAFHDGSFSALARRTRSAKR